MSGSERPAALPFPLLRRGKVRELYAVDREHLLLVASDRVSAFDVVLEEPVPGKGEVLTLLTAWWLERLERITAHHLVAVHPDEVEARAPDLTPYRKLWARRGMLVRRTAPLPVECVVRGYLAGSAWKEYTNRGTLAGEPLPDGLAEADRLPEPLFSPATKAMEGHDENISYEETVGRVGPELAGELRRRSLELYEAGAERTRQQGIILADTKFEFGTDDSGELLLIDEVLTPDSSRFWPAEHYEPGGSQPSLDKQPIRDYLDGLEDWPKTAPPPPLPDEVVAAAADRYRQLFRRLTGEELETYTPPRLEGAHS